MYHIDGLTFAMIVVLELPPSESCNKWRTKWKTVMNHLQHIQTTKLHLSFPFCSRNFSPGGETLA